MPSFKANATRRQLVGTTTVLKTGVIDAEPDKVTVLVYANRSSTTKDAETPRLPESLRLKMTMVEVDGKWLAKGGRHLLIRPDPASSAFRLRMSWPPPASDPSRP